MPLFFIRSTYRIRKAQMDFEIFENKFNRRHYIAVNYDIGGLKMVLLTDLWLPSTIVQILVWPPQTDFARKATVFREKREIFFSVSKHSSLATAKMFNIKWAHPGLFLCLFSFFSHHKCSTNLNINDKLDPKFHWLRQMATTLREFHWRFFGCNWQS